MIEIDEYGQLYTSGSVLLRSDNIDDDIYPLDKWIENNRRHGGKVLKRRIIVIEDWEEV